MHFAQVSPDIHGPFHARGHKETQREEVKQTAQERRRAIGGPHIQLLFRKDRREDDSAGLIGAIGKAEPDGFRCYSLQVGGDGTERIRGKTELYAVALDEHEKVVVVVRPGTCGVLADDHHGLPVREITARNFLVPAFHGTIERRN